MRVRNKELRARRHRKDQKIKEATKALIAQFGAGSKPVNTTGAPKKAAAKKPAAKKAAPKKDAE